MHVCWLSTNELYEIAYDIGVTRVVACCFATLYSIQVVVLNLTSPIVFPQGLKVKNSSSYKLPTVTATTSHIDMINPLIVCIAHHVSFISHLIWNTWFYLRRDGGPTRSTTTRGRARSKKYDSQKNKVHACSFDSWEEAYYQPQYSCNGVGSYLGNNTLQVSQKSIKKSQVSTSVPSDFSLK